MHFWCTHKMEDHTYPICFIETLGLLDTAVKMWVVCMCVFIPSINPEGSSVCVCVYKPCINPLLNRMLQSNLKDTTCFSKRANQPPATSSVWASCLHISHLKCPRLTCDANCCYSDDPWYEPPFMLLVTWHCLSSTFEELWWYSHQVVCNYLHVSSTQNLCGYVLQIPSPRLWLT